MENKIFTFEEANAAWFCTFEHKNCVHKYKTADGFVHLIIDGKDVLDGLDAIECHYGREGVVEYKTAEVKSHQINLKKD